MRISAATLLLILCLGATSATARPTPLDLGKPRPNPERQWTFIAYVMADNNLEGYLLDNIDQMERALPEGKVEVLALIDRAKKFADQDGDWTEARIYRLRRGDGEKKIESEKLATLGEVATGQGDLLAGFIRSAIETFPAKHYALLLSDHGSGWGNAGCDDDVPGDEKGAADLTPLEVAAAIAEARKATGTGKLDLVIFDECLMAQLDVALALEPHARVMVAAEAPMPGVGFSYDRIMDAFATETDPAVIAGRFVKSMEERTGFAALMDVTVSAIDLARVPEVVKALDALCVKAGPRLGDLWPAVSRSVFFAENFAGRLDYRDGVSAFSPIDLVDLTRRLRRLGGKDFPAAAEAKRLEEAVLACVLHEHASAVWGGAHGLAIYAPVRSDNMREDYADAPLAKATGWRKFLSDLHAKQAAQTAVPRIHGTRLLGPTGQPVKAAQGLGGTHLEFTVEGKNILWTLASQVRPTMRPGVYAVMFRTFVHDPRRQESPDDEADELVLRAMPRYVDGANVLKREIGGLAYKITDGKNLFEATIDLSDPADIGHVRVPAIYSHPKTGDLLADLIFDTNTGTATAIEGKVKTSEGAIYTMMVEPERDAGITFLVYTVTAQGEIGMERTGMTTWGDGLELLLEFQRPGKYAMVLEAESIGGKSTHAVFPYDQLRNEAFEALVAKGGRYEAGDLVGAWTLQNATVDEKTGQIRWGETGSTLSFEAREKSRAQLSYALTQAGEATAAGAVVVDTRGAPTLVFCDVDEEDRLTRTDSYVAIRTEEGGKPCFILKDINLGSVLRLLPGKIEVVADLDGTWTNAEGIKIVLGDGRYEFHVGGKEQDRGRFRAAGGRIFASSDSGGVETLTCEIDGDTLTLVDEDGTKFVLTRGR